MRCLLDSGITISPVTVVGFDDLNTTSVGIGVGSLPSTYAGLDFSCIDPFFCGPVDASTYQGNPSGYQGAVVSGTKVLGAASPLTISLEGGGKFTFDSAYLTGARAEPWMLGHSAASGPGVGIQIVPQDRTFALDEE